MERIQNKKISVPIKLSNIRRYDTKKDLVKYKYVFNIRVKKDIVARNHTIWADNEKILVELLIWEIEKSIDYWTK